MYNHYEIANLPDSDLRDIFLQVSSEMNLPPSLVEKDFWVSLMLKYLYSDSPWKHRLLFKGGTSLSKCYGAIHRFSEDIDLLLDWCELGYPEEGPGCNLVTADHPRDYMERREHKVRGLPITIGSDCWQQCFLV